MLHEILAELYPYARGALRYRWVALALAWLIAIAGWVYVSTLPNQYQATARLFVDTQSVLQPLLAGLAVQPDFAERVSLMSRVLLSRPNLEKAVGLSDLELKLRTNQEREALLSRLAAKVRISGERNSPIYNISYEDPDPNDATKMVQALVTIFMEEALEGGQTDTTTAQNFLEEEISSYDSRLRQAELRLADFKRENAGLLPGDSGYYANLEKEKASLKDARLALEEATRRRDLLLQQLESENRRVLNDANSAANLGLLDPRIAEVQSRLDDLLLRFTDRHPDVIELKRLIADLKRRSVLSQAEATQSGLTIQASTVYGNLKVAINEAEAEVASLQARVNDYQSRVSELNEQIGKIPTIEAQLTQLSREYNTIANQHSELVERRESARLSQEVQKTTEGIKFRLINPPRAPSTPSAPNRVLLAAAVLLISIGAGAAGAIAIDLLRPVYDDIRILSRSTGLPTLGVVTLIQTPQQEQREKRLWIPFLILLFGLILGSLIVGLDLPNRYFG